MSNTRTSGLRAILVALYRNLADKFPFTVPIYRNIAHRETYPPFRRKYAIGKLHEAIKHEFGQRRGGFFFEAGANDGLLFSNTAYLERYCDWKGLLVEAVPHKFVECLYNRPKSIVEHCALVSLDYETPYVEILYSDLMSFAPSLTQIDHEKQIAMGSDFLLAKERALSGKLFLAPTRPIAAILSKHDVRHIDLMVLDLEGAELEALMGIDFNLCRVESILIETRDLQAIDDYLLARRFRRHAQLDHNDYLYRLA